MRVEYATPPSVRALALAETCGAVPYPAISAAAATRR